MEEKMAFLILAHRDDQTLRTLCRMLDDPRADLFIHMDAKNSTYDETAIPRLMKYSRVFHTSRTSVSWGGYSLVHAELLLLKLALAHGPYCHLHLLSGEDLPIKPMDEIHRFFTANSRREFVAFDSPDFACGDRVHYFYRFQEKVGRSRGLLFKLQKLDVALQKGLHMTRNRDFAFQKGSNWFSITDSFARYVVSREAWIRRTFRNTRIPDELFIQTLLLHSPYFENRYDTRFDDSGEGNMRLIDWQPGGPHVFTAEDFPRLMASDRMFARKFQAARDSRILTMVAHACGSEADT